MRALLSFSAFIDALLKSIAQIGKWAGVGLVVVVMYDITTRYLGVPRGFGLNATQLQEGEYWLHTILFSLVIAHAYTAQSHVRIDLFREKLPYKARYLIEVLGCVLFLLPYCAIVGYFTFNYAFASFQEGEISKSVIGLTHIFILKSFLVALYLLLGLAGISQLFKSIAGFTGVLPDDRIADTIGGDH